MTAKVKILDFRRRDEKTEFAEKKLEDFLNQGYVIAGQSESDGWLSYTLVLIPEPTYVAINFGVDGEYPRTARLSPSVAPLEVPPSKLISGLH